MKEQVTKLFLDVDARQLKIELPLDGDEDSSRSGKKDLGVGEEQVMPP